jgi:hypothetical protein
MRFWRASLRGLDSGSWLPVMTMGLRKPAGVERGRWWLDAWRAAGGECGGEPAAPPRADTPDAPRHPAAARDSRASMRLNAAAVYAMVSVP